LDTLDTLRDRVLGNPQLDLVSNRSLLLFVQRKDEESDDLFDTSLCVLKMSKRKKEVRQHL
jgi:hypothetical protein